jgi:protein SCO1
MWTMKTRTWLLPAALLGVWTMPGCERAPEEPSAAPAATEKESDAMEKASDYPITGRVTMIAADKKAVTLDHEDIPGLMPGMEMEFTVEDPQILENIEPGAEVQGRLRVQDGQYVITELQKQ